MKFPGELDEVSLARTQRCNVRLRDPARLQTIRNTGLLDTPPEEAFDRLARLAAQLLDVPLTIFSLVADDRQFFKADYGLPSPFKETRTLPIDASLCRYTLEAEPIISSNAPVDPFLASTPRRALGASSRSSCCRSFIRRGTCWERSAASSLRRASGRSVT